MRRQSRFNRNHKNSMKKERIIMIASSVFVLAALTMTGVYVKSNSQKSQNDGYHIDFSALENAAEKNNLSNEFAEIKVEEPIMPQVTEDDLDYTPMEQVGSGIIQIPGLTDQVSENIIGETEAIREETLLEGENAIEGAEGLGGIENAEDAKTLMEEAMEQDAEEIAQAEDVESDVVQNQPSFAAGDRLVWPVSGSVLIPYSMDKTVYFSTLQQYKYNPAMVVSATEGDDIAAAASGEVKSVFYDEEIGNAVTVNIGNGYEITYGQLKDIEVSEGDYLEQGSVIGYVASPTKYYSVEGTNAYFALTLNGEPADPMGQLQ